MRKGFGFHDRHSPFRFDPATLFVGGAVQGVLYDPSALATLFQDAAGTNPVVAANDPVGLILDMSKQQSFVARRNLLTYSQDLTNAAWTTSLGTTKDSATTFTIGTGATAEVRQILAPTGGTASKTFTASVTISVASGTSLFRIKNTHGGVVDNFSANLTATTTPTRFSFTVTNSSSAGDGNQILGIVNASDASSNGKQFILHDAQLEVSATATAYQQTAQWPVSWLGNHAYQTSGTSRPLWQQSNSLSYLTFDGSNDGFLTNAVNFTSTNQVTICAGMRKLSATAAQIFLELGPDIGATQGSFAIGTPWASAQRDGVYARGNGGASENGVLSAASQPVTQVLTGQMGITPASIVMRRNGAQVASSTSGFGTGNYGNHSMYIGRRNNATLPLNGRLYGLIVLGAAASDWQVYVTEQWMASKTGLQF